MKVKIGYGSCPGCAAAGRTNRVMFRQDDATGTLSYNCDECDGGDYAKPHQQKHRDWMARLENKPAPKADPKPEPKAAPKSDDKGKAKPAAAFPWQNH